MLKVQAFDDAYADVIGKIWRLNHYKMMIRDKRKSKETQGNTQLEKKVNKV